MDLVLIPAKGRPAPRRARPDRSAGFSLVEVLVAAVLLLVILLGILPLFVRSSVNRVSGRESTDVASFARSSAESLLQLPFDHPDVSVPPGDAELVVVEYLEPGSEVWTRDAAASATAQWVRTVRVRQFASRDLLDGDTDGDGDSLDDPRPGGSDSRSIQLKEVEVAVTSPRQGGPFGAGEQITVRFLKAF